MGRRSWTTMVVAMLCASMVDVAPSGQTTQGAPGRATPRPVSLVAAMGEQLVVLKSLDGSPSLIEGPMRGLYPASEREWTIRGRFANVTAIAVAPDGRSLIVVNGARDCRTSGGFEEGSYQPEIDRVVIETGSRDRVVGGSDFPVVNAMGIVAYGGICNGGGFFAFTDMVTGYNARRGAFGESADSSLPVTSLKPIAWLSDGRTLFYAITVSGEAHSRYYFGRVWPLVTPNEEVFRRVAASVGEGGTEPTAAALVDDTTIAFAQDDAAGARVRQWDVATGRFREDRSYRLPESVTSLTVDPSGTHILAVTARHVLYRWSVGETSPTRLAEGVSAASWLP